MIVNFSTSELHDYDLPFLKGQLEWIDQKLIEIQREPYKLTEEYYLDDQRERLEYFSGLGFIGIQRYLTSTIKSNKLALDLEPLHPNGRSFARIFNAAANFWKHSDEWDYNNLTKHAETTIETIGSVLGNETQGCYDILIALCGDNPVEFKSLTGKILEWRSNFIRSYLKSNSKDRI